MEALVLVMTVLTVSGAAMIIPRMMVDWQRCREYLSDDDETALRSFAAEQRQWILRHGICAAGAIGMVAIISCAPEMAPFERLAGITTAYGMMTLTFALVESLLAQRAENRLQTRPGPSRQVREFGR